MPESPRAQATLLLTLSLPGDATAARPLSIAEWSHVSRWLHGRGLAPEVLLERNGDVLLSEWNDARIPRERLIQLLERRFALAVATERWESTGIWFVTRGEQSYPTTLRARLREKAPPFLCGVGDPSLLSRALIAIVGSRKASEEALKIARELASETVRAGKGVVSGSARGIDSEAMMASIEAGGCSVGVLADDLLKASRNKQWRGPLMNGHLTLVSPFGVERRFSVGHAMARNKLIYCLSERAAVIATSVGSGGTWTGATENLSHRWVRLFVHEHACGRVGTNELEKQGAIRFALSGEVVRDQGDASISEAPASVRVAESPSIAYPEAADSYDDFVVQLRSSLVSTRGLSAVELSEALRLPKRRLSEWIKRAKAEGFVELKGNPRTYRWREPQSDLFGQATSRD